MTHEMFPPTEQELEEMIFTLTKKLEDERYRDEWPELAEERQRKEKELEEKRKEKQQ